jgi:hypothetical protein
VIALIVLTIATRGLFIAVSAQYADRAQPVINGGGLMDRLHLHNSAVQVKSVLDLELILYVVCGIAFIAWFARAYRNLRRTGLPDLRYPESWSILMWFLPVGNLIWPKAMANDIWRAGRSEAVQSPDGWQRLSVSPLVHVWWVIWILPTFLALAYSRLIFPSDPPTSTIDALNRLQQGLSVAQIAAVVDIVAAALAIAFVWQITRRQDRLTELLQVHGRVPASVEGAGVPPG